MATAFKIERHVPVPADIGRGRRSLYPFSDMAVGDSIVVETMAGVRAAHQWGGRHGKAFATRQIERGSNKIRIWRVK